MELSRLSISPARRLLIDQSHGTQFGRIENLTVENGEPRFGPSTRIVRTVTFNGADNPARSPESDDFELKRPWLELFAYLDRIGNGTIERIDLKHGLPCYMAVEEQLSP